GPGAVVRTNVRSERRADGGRHFARPAGSAVGVTSGAIVPVWIERDRSLDLLGAGDGAVGCRAGSRLDSGTAGGHGGSHGRVAARLIRDLVRFPLPLRKRGQRFLAQELDHRDRALRLRKTKLLVDERIVKPDPGG